MGAHQSAKSGLSGLQVVAVLIVGLAAIGLAVYGAVTSYVSVRTMALAHDVPFPRLTPVGIDGGLLTVVALDIVLTWIGHPLRAIRWLARLFSLATVGANALSGWPDPVAVGLHITPSVLLVIVVEGVRAVLLRTQDDKKPGTTDQQAVIEPIPRLRWLLAPFKTFGLWRRMVLWHVPSYARAIDLELSRRQAVVRLKEHFGPEWKREAPNDLVWMLRSGVRIPEACTRVDMIVSPKPDKPKPEPDERRADRVRQRGRRHLAPGNGQSGVRVRGRNEAGNGHHENSGNDTRPAPGNGLGTITRNGLAAMPGTAAISPLAGASDPTQDAELMARGRAIIAAWAAQRGGQITLDEFTPLLGRQRAVASRVRRALLDELAGPGETVEAQQ